MTKNTRYDRFSRVLDDSSNIIPGTLEHRNSSEMCMSRCRVNRPFDGHATPDLAIVLFSAGRCDFENLDLGFGRSRASTSPGDFVLIPPNMYSSAKGAGSFEQLSVAIPWASVVRDLELATGCSVSHFGSLHSSVNRDIHVEQIVRSLWASQLFVESELRVDALVAILAMRLLTLSGNQFRMVDSRRKTLERSVLQTLVDFMYHNLDSRITLEDLADIADCGRFHFCRLFKNTTGQSPNQFLIRMRVEVAKARIKRGESFVQAALESGFSDQAHLSRQFKKFVGVTPGQFRRVHCH